MKLDKKKLTNKDFPCMRVFVLSPKTKARKSWKFYKNIVELKYKNVPLKTLQITSVSK